VRGRLAPGPAWLYPLKAAATGARSTAWLARTRGRQEGHGIRILFYHRVSADPDELAVRPDRFRRQMEWLAGEGYRVLDVRSVADLLAHGEGGRRVLGLSFDDGYRDVAEHALPVLERLGFRATVFVATGVIDGSATLAWYERQPPLLGWKEIERLDHQGTLSFEAHTVTHPNLVALGEDDARAEIAGSKRALERHLGRPVEAFCYPAGLAGPRDRALVAEAGFSVAASCEPGVNTAATDPLALRRRQVDARDRLLDFRAKVGGGHDSPLPLRSAWRRTRYGSGAMPAETSARR
jgi:peptidoglycan/xylan/chitin deacetylase (PgdA/CDA1 family)